MGKKAIATWLVSLALISFHLADAQQPAKVPPIGYLTGSPISAMGTRIDAFRQRLRELGYVEDNIIIEWRSSDGKFDRLPALAADLVRLKVDIIVTVGGRRPVQSKKRLRQFRLSWRRIPILWGTGLLPAWRGQAGTSPGCSPLLRS